MRATTGNFILKSIRESIQKRVLSPIQQHIKITSQQERDSVFNRNSAESCNQLYIKDILSGV